MNTPPEYFGPHAKRWTDPDTGETLSLSPRDYYRKVAAAQLQREKEVEERVAESAAWNDEALDEPPVVIAPSGWSAPEGQRYVVEVEEESSPIPPEMAGRYDAIVYGATRGGIKYPTTESLVRGRVHSATLSHDGMGHVSTSSSEPAVPVCPQEQPAAHHLRERLTSPRFWVTLGLVYIIAIIGVTAATGVIS